MWKIKKMIDIKSLKESDTNRKVIYKKPNGKSEEGRITSWNDRFIFVDYYNNGMGAATNPKNLEFIQ